MTTLNYDQIKMNSARPYNPKTPVYPKADNDFAKNPDYELVWHDEFDGEQINLDNWAFETGFVRNREPQYYTENRKENARVEDGNLIIEVRKEKYAGKSYDWDTESIKEVVAEYTSADLITRPKHAWKYGVFEAKVKVPVTNNATWPAFWTMGCGENGEEMGWPQCGEIDIMEFFGNVAFNRYETHAIWNSPPGCENPYQFQEMHTEIIDGETTVYQKDHPVGNEWMVLGIEWDEQKIRFYADDITICSIDITDPSMSAFHRKHFILLNYALRPEMIDGVSDEQFPQQYLVDYVRVYQKKKK